MYLILLADRREVGGPMAVLGVRRDGRGRAVDRLRDAFVYRSLADAEEDAHEFNLAQSRWKACVWSETPSVEAIERALEASAKGGRR